MKIGFEIKYSTMEIVFKFENYDDMATFMEILHETDMVE